MTDLRSLGDFGDPGASEQRLRAAADLAEQEALEAELDAIGATDPYADEERAPLRP